jgi:hypothetical protein
MATKIRRVDYFYTSVKDQPGAAYEVLSALAARDVNLLAFGLVPLGPNRAQITLFPENVEKLAAAAERLGLGLDGPYAALLVQGDDRLGAAAAVHARLRDANINVYASNGVTDGEGSFGYVLYMQHGDIEAALSVLED